MRPHGSLMAALALPLAALLSATGVAAQNPHVGHVASSFGDTPEQRGLLPTALAEARVAAQHAGLAARDLTNLDAMKLHAGHVLHAVDPTQIDKGPGLGYGVEKAAMGVARHIELAAQVDGAEQAIQTHSVHIARSARNTVERAERLAELANEIRAASTADEAAPLTRELDTVATQLLAGVDANGDGRIGWQEGEGGLETAQNHLELMQSALDSK